MADPRITVQPIGRDELLEAANACHAAGASWHFHLLSPDCQLNPTPGFYVCVLEHSGQVFSYTSTDPLDEMGLELAPLLHGAGVFDDHAMFWPAGGRSGQMIERARRLTVAGKDWHHHQLAPDCAFNRQPGTWTLMLEDDRFAERVQFLNEPRRQLGELERLYYIRVPAVRY